MPPPSPSRSEHAPETAPVAARASPRQVLVALTPEERRLFCFAISEFGLARHHELDTNGMSADDWNEALRRINPEVVVSCWSTPPIPEAWLEDRACALRYVCHLAGSVRRLVPRSFLERGGIVTNWGALAARSVAEQALLLALLALRDHGSWRRAIAAPSGQRRHDGVRTRPLHGCRVGLHGFGGVARALVELLRPFRVSLYAYSAGVPDAVLLEHGVTPAGSLGEMFSQSDICFECEALTPSTERSVTAEMLKQLPDGAVFVNVARGRLIDEEALAAEASNGRLRVAVDVMSKEPAQPDSLLCRTPGVIVSPHIGGPTLQEYPHCGELARANLMRYIGGEPLEALVSLACYDRST